MTNRRTEKPAIWLFIKEVKKSAISFGGDDDIYNFFFGEHPDFAAFAAGTYISRSFSRLILEQEKSASPIFYLLCMLPAKILPLQVVESAYG